MKSSRVTAVVFLALGACARPGIPPVVLPFPADTNVTRMIAPGVSYRSIRSRTGPWAVEVLDVDLSRCYSAIAVKGVAAAAGRRRTSELLTALRDSQELIGGVNADFFSLAGFQGIPTGALISRGRVIVGPYTQPVVAIDSAGRPHLTPLATVGSVTHHGQDRGRLAWNRPAPNGIAAYDPNWGPALDTATGTVEVTVEGSSPSRITRVDTTIAGATIPQNGHVIVVGRNAPSELHDWAATLAVGDTLRIALALAPFHPMETVGGRPMLVRDSVVAPEVETEGQLSFRNRNPRTALGLAGNGRRMILVVVDGRRAGYSDGMTLRETAELMRSLGARDAINLDGGGSSVLVYMDPASRSPRIANRPSDATGERPVGDALAIVKGCRR